MDVYVTDSHALLWFMTRNPKLSSPAQGIIRQAETGEVNVLIPTIVLAEIDNVIRKKNLEITIQKIIGRISQGDGFDIAAFDLDIFQTMLTLPANLEIHDRLIAATSCYHEAPLITRDETFQDSDAVQTIW